jgi:hypothetical protein
MITFNEDIHCRPCVGLGHNPHTEVDCPSCGGTGYKEIMVGHGPKSKNHVITRHLPQTPGKPYSAPVRTACGKLLSGLMVFSWVQPTASLDRLECQGCLDYVHKILSK